MLKVIESRVSDQSPRDAVPGTVISLSNGCITVACKQGAVDLLTVLPEGKKRMRASDFINGRRIFTGDVLN